MIIVQLQGGLGNQMFQYALGRSLTYSKNCKLILDCSWFEGNNERFFQLSEFRITADILTKKGKNIILPFEGHRNNIFNLIPFFSNKKENFKIIKEKGTSFDSEIIDTPDNSYIVGYWQSEQYFLENSEIIRQDFQLNNQPSGKNLEIIPLLINSDSVAIHIRRGDYITNSNANRTHGLCSLAYYYKAMMYLESKVQNPRYLIFTDDPEWVKKHFSSTRPIQIIDWNFQSPWLDMHLISLCKHHIIANSSFSWWGAWLGKKLGQIVIAPEPWYEEPIHQTDSIYVPDWIRLSKKGTS